MKYSKTSFLEKMNNYGFNLKKMYGQNFIIDENIINNIILKSSITSDTLVIEIGPGAGSLTYKLSSRAKNVLCYEIDTSLSELLKDNLSECNNVDIIYCDFLKANVIDDIKRYDYKNLFVVANLPYYITTPIILKIIKDKIPVDKIVVMVQKEVGNRFKAVPNTKDYNSLSVYLNYYFNVKKLLDVSKNVFIPKPNVDSIVVEFTKNCNNYNLKDEDKFFALVRDSFTQKRKTLKNNLKNYDLDRINKVLSKYDLDLNARAENLSLEIFVDIANNI
ncbi:MAG: 16S rRNA (adenine(1518)-N(6)/adenine(1519)-N(6))-dimethyltransferase RsmA [bacterium]|nr:16S rRNA (adenine(1518)-N(6)/adenine(1519)-N(6))-dimethyltransferase RsmA [bacterium]